MRSIYRRERLRAELRWLPPSALIDGNIQIIGSTDYNDGNVLELYLQLSVTENSLEFNETSVDLDAISQLRLDVRAEFRLLGSAKIELMPAMHRILPKRESFICRFSASNAHYQILVAELYQQNQLIATSTTTVLPHFIWKWPPDSILQ